MSVSFLAELEALEGLRVEDLQLLDELFEQRSFGEGELLIEQGQRCEQLILLLEGELQVARTKVDRTVLAQVGGCEWVGVVDAIDGRGATASVLGCAGSSGLVLRRSELDRLLAAGHPTGARLLRSWIRSLGQQLSRVNRGNEAMLKLAARLAQPQGER